MSHSCAPPTPPPSAKRQLPSDSYDEHAYKRTRMDDHAVLPFPSPQVITSVSSSSTPCTPAPQTPSEDPLSSESAAVRSATNGILATMHHQSTPSSSSTLTPRRVSAAARRQSISAAPRVPLSRYLRFKKKYDVACGRLAHVKATNQSLHWDVNLLDICE